MFTDGMAQPKDWTHLFENYPDKWVALAEDETTVLAAGETAKDAHAAALKHSSLPILYHVPETSDLFAGYRRLRREALSRFSPEHTIHTIKRYHRQVCGYAYHRPKLELLRAGRLDDKRASNYLTAES